MLVLTRGFGESVMIGNNVVVTILKIENDKVSVGVEAPKEITVHREEIFRRLQKEGTIEST